MKMRSITAVIALSAFASMGIAVAHADSRSALADAQPSALVPLLAESRSTNQPVPELIDLEDTEILSSSVRYVGDSDLGKHWVGSDNESNICVITEMTDDLGAANVGGIACTPREDFFQRGLTLRLEEGGGEGVVSHLLPSDAKAPELEQSGTAANSRHSGEDIEVIEQSDTTLLVLSTDSADQRGSIEVQRSTELGELKLSPLTGSLR
ncbi:hypothetical protein ACFSYH_11855 [Populibacterium corticicola]|uniref:Uncharacterized protein n=1 Tax=Populibacterium corticicola TaxID=1812826 RepID=A0ABW5XK46_9MICO